MAISLNMKDIVPNDSTIFESTKGLYVGVSGDVKIDTADGDTITLKNLASGVIHPISVIKVHSTETTATDILAVY